MRRIAALGLALSLLGCSFVTTHGPDTSSPQVFPDCTTSMTWPIVDGVFALLFSVAMLGAIGDNTMDGSGAATGGDEATGTIVGTAVLAVATGAGAFVGYSRVSRCKSARAGYVHPQQQGYGQPYSPQPYQPYPQPYQPYPQPYYPPAQPQPVQPQPAQPPAQPLPPPPLSSGLGTEGDVCASSAECATGLTCGSNVCIRPATRPPAPRPTAPPPPPPPGGPR